MSIIKNKYLSVMAWVGSVMALGFISGMSTKDSIINWYSTLHRSSLTPPNFVFGPVWSVLYVILGITGYLLWKNKSSIATKSLFLFQLALNFAWSTLFFTLHSPGAAFLCLFTMILCSTFIMWKNWPKTTALLLIPYFMWLSFAAYLNFYVWMCN